METPIRRYLILLILTFQVGIYLHAQEVKKTELKVQFDSRNTLINKETVGIFGLRVGLPFKDKYEIGIGLYASRVLDFFGKEIEKDYLDNSITPSQTLPAVIGFKYFSIYGEYTLVDNKRWNITANSQYGLGQVFIELTESNGSLRKKTEGKSLIEHSLKAKYQLNSWLQLIGGLGYRYLISGEEQIKNAFNAPIYIISAEIDFRGVLTAIKGK